MSIKQQTLKAPISFSGKGLHTGVEVTMTIHPAGVDNGIVFRRVDVEGTPLIPALCDNVTDTSRGTTIESNGVKVATIEHIMSALWTLGVDNALIDIDAGETPIMDGSAREYAEKIVETGLVDVLMFSVNPCYDLQPAGEDVDALWADESYAKALHNIDPERERLYELCERTGVGIDVMKVYGGGDLLSEANSPFGRALTPVQCIEYALTRPAVAAVMVGCKSREEIEAALAWCDAPAAARDYASAMAGLERFSWQGHCMYCGHCAPCSAGIDIAAVNKFYNLTAAEEEIPETVREHYKVLTHHASECIGCGLCESRCPFGVEIVDAIRRAAERFGY